MRCNFAGALNGFRIHGPSVFGIDDPGVTTTTMAAPAPKTSASPATTPWPAILGEGSYAQCEHEEPNRPKLKHAFHQ